MIKENNMTQKELINAIAKESGLTKKDTKKFMKAFTKVVENTLKDGRILPIYKFGSFFPRVSKEKVVKSKYLDEPMKINERISYKFKFTKYFLDEIMKADNEE